MTGLAVPSRPVRAAPLTERAFQARVLDLAKLYGWMVFHPYSSRRSTAGFPDLVLARHGQVLFVELKTDTGQLSVAQRQWRDALPDARCWRPRDWRDGTIARHLRDGL